MPEMIKGQLNEISAAALDIGIRFYKLPRLIFEALGYTPKATEIFLGLATLVEGVKLAKARGLVKSDDQRMRLMRSEKMSTDKFKNFVDELTTYKKWKAIDWESLEDDVGTDNAPRLLLSFVHGWSSDITGNFLEPWFLDVLSYYQTILKQDIELISHISSLATLESKKAELITAFENQLGIKLIPQIHLETQEFSLKVAVLKNFAALTELLMVDNLNHFKQHQPIYVKLLPTVGKPDELILSSNQLMRLMFERWQQVSESRTKMKTEFYKYLLLHMQGKAAQKSKIEKIDPELSVVKKQIQRWESGKSVIKINKFWPMFSWAFPELCIGNTSENKQPLQILLMLLTVNLLTKAQLAALKCKISPESIAQDFSCYDRLFSQRKSDFLSWYVEK